MGNFSLISIAKDNEAIEKYRVLNIFGNKIKDILIPKMPDYISGTVSDMGIPGYKVSGCRISIPSASGDNELVRKKLKKVYYRLKRLNPDVLVVDPSIPPGYLDANIKVKISTGNLFTPAAAIDAVKSISALVGIDFRRSNICIADAGNSMGRIAAELLLEEASYLVLHTENKDSISDRIPEYIMRTGISPAVISNPRKAMNECDILIYTGGADISKLTSFVSHKMLIVNLTGGVIYCEKDFLTIDDVLLDCGSIPPVEASDANKHIFLTSRAWEGALLTISDIDPKPFTINKAREIKNTAKSLGIRMTSAIREGKVLHKEKILKYR